MSTKIIKTCALLVITLCATGTLADNFYLKGGLGLNLLDTNSKNLKANNTFPLLEVGFGVDNDFANLELVYDYYFIFNTEEKITKDNEIADIKGKTKLDAIFIQALFPIYEFEKVKFSLGGGAGISFSTEDYQMLAITEGFCGRFGQKTKTNNNLSWRGIASLDFKINDSLTLQNSYNYFDLGKSKQGRYQYKIHNIQVGLKYSL